MVTATISATVTAEQAQKLETLENKSRVIREALNEYLEDLEEETVETQHQFIDWKDLSRKQEKFLWLALKDPGLPREAPDLCQTAVKHGIYMDTTWAKKALQFFIANESIPLQKEGSTIKVEDSEKMHEKVECPGCEGRLSRKAAVKHGLRCPSCGRALGQGDRPGDTR
jgi:hypothetical protein